MLTQSAVLIAGEDYVLNEVEFFKSSHLFRLPASTAVFAGAPRVFYEQLRNSWLIVKRESPVVPCPTATVLPTRSMSKHQRAKLYNVYLRPWTLLEKLADADVLFAGDFGLPSADSVGTVRQQWKQYIRNIWPHALRTVRNFMANSWAESHRDEEEDDIRHGPSMTYAMTLADVERVLAAERNLPVVENKEVEKGMSTVQRSTEVAMSLCKRQSTGACFNEARSELVLQRQNRLQASHSVLKDAKMNAMPHSEVAVERRDWRVIDAAYKTWYDEVYVDTSTKVPTAQQKMFLITVHLRRKYEYFVEQGLVFTEDIMHLSAAPLYRLVHGLPGAGKSQLLLWLRSYFEVVWKWTHGDQFVFLAAMNSMADNIGGNTMHSYFAVSFLDHRGVSISHTAADQNWNSLLTKMSLLEFVFIDEVEGAAVELLGKIEEEARRSTRRPDVYRYPGESEETRPGRLPRAWGGVNVFLIGDWWQLHPQGIALMSNPFSKTVAECSTAQAVMASVWCIGSAAEEDTAVHFLLQEWEPSRRVLELSTNIRSGKDRWWNEVLEQCRIGALSADNFDWIHGYPAASYVSNSPLRFWYETREKNDPCHDVHCDDTCAYCQREVKRRNRLFPEDVMPEEFKDATLITPHNQAVFHYSLHCAREFAKRRHRQLMWCPPRDTAPAFFVAGYTHEEMRRKQQNWLFYHARSTQGILSLCPLAYDLPFRITRGNGKDMKEHGINNGARGRLRDWTLHDDDVVRLQNCTDGEVTLTELPLVLVLFMETPMRKKHPDYPEQHFPLTPVTTYWFLGGSSGSEAVEIRRRGFAMVPDFATTIDGAVGRTMDKAVVALGQWTDVASPTKAMKGYIGLSRVKCADDLRLAEPFSPCLFSQGPQPWPTFLLSVQTGSVAVDEGFAERCRQVQAEAGKMKKLTASQFYCSTCSVLQPLNHFVSARQDSADWYEEIQQCVLLPGGGGRSCRRRKEKPKALYICELCGLLKPPEDFGTSAVHNFADKSQRSLCKQCARPPCTNPECKTCKECRQPECTGGPLCSQSLLPLHPKQLPTKITDLDDWLCQVCRKRYLCVVGNHWVSAAEISDSVSHNSSDKDRNIICKDHARPSCTNPNCTVCSTCRQPHRRSSKPCTRLWTPLHWTQRPQHGHELTAWLCEVCRPRLCSNWPRCTKENRSKKTAPHKTGYTCGECLTLEFNKADHRKHFSKK